MADDGRPKKLRAFVAVPLEAGVERAVELLEQVRARCDRAGVRANWVRPENLHLTLAFLGGVEPSGVEAIAGALAPLSAHRSFAIELRGVGRFPPAGKPRVLWMGVGAGADRLEAIASEVADRLAPLGFSPDCRPFHPHFTLARVKRATRAADDVLNHFRDADGGVSRVSELVLLQSLTRPEGPEYTPLARVP
ncbi:MAG: RNA 2',3'-cyclic phosphodiesterase, partial [Myxococcota bacterium]